MNNSLVIREEIQTAITKEINPVELARVLYPRIERAIELANTPEEVNELRAQIETINTYIKRALPKFIKERQEQFKTTHEGDMLYVRASGKAGELWDACEDKRLHGGDRKSIQVANSPLDKLSVTDAGFKGSRDATTCKRIGDLHDEDLRTYDEDTFQNMKQATLNGAERVWLMLFQADPPQPIDGKYRIIYADPPWTYGNMRFDGATMPDDHYPVMTIDELCELPIKEAAENDAVLFLWVTSPILEDAFRVIKAWGFEYKTSFVWDKVKHNMGHYNSVRHEFLLVCTRGSCQPDVMKLFDSVVTVERGKHSEKPEAFREIIDHLYIHGNRIELFATKQTEGWVAYGNDIST